MTNASFSQWVNTVNRTGLGDSIDRLADTQKVAATTTDWDRSWSGYRSGESILIEREIRQNISEQERAIYCCSLDDAEETPGDELYILPGEELIMLREDYV